MFSMAGGIAPDTYVNLITDIPEGPFPSICEIDMSRLDKAFDTAFSDHVCLTQPKKIFPAWLEFSRFSVSAFYKDGERSL